jgi:hypothetical protein
MATTIKWPIPAPLRTVANFILYPFVVLQFMVLLKLMHDMDQQHRLSVWDWTLPIRYFGPLGIGVAFRQFIKLLVRNASMSSEAAMICNDWLTTLLIIVYGILLDFRLLN